jgi:hypothetical protein
MRIGASLFGVLSLFSNSDQMTQPSNNAPGGKNFHITLELSPGESLDPAKHIRFEPPRGSQALKHALREFYPNLKTHQERVREAVTDFYLTVRNQGESLLDVPSTPKSPTEYQPPITASYVALLPCKVGTYNLADKYQFRTRISNYEK